MRGAQGRKRTIADGMLCVHCTQTYPDMIGNSLFVLAGVFPFMSIYSNH